MAIDTKGLGIDELSLYDALIKHYFDREDDDEELDLEDIDDLFTTNNEEP